MTEEITGIDLVQVRLLWLFLACYAACWWPMQPDARGVQRERSPAPEAAWLGWGPPPLLVATAPRTQPHFAHPCAHAKLHNVTSTHALQAQIRIAGGATLAQLGLGSQEDVPKPNGCAQGCRFSALQVVVGGCW